MKRDACSCQKKSTSLFPWTLSLFFLKKELTLYSNLAIIKNKGGRFMNDDFFRRSPALTGAKLSACSNGKT